MPPLLAGLLASSAIAKLTALGVGATALVGGAMAADAATDGGLHLGIGHDGPSAVVSSQGAGEEHPPSHAKGEPGGGADQGAPRGGAGDDGEGAGEGGGPEDNHGADVSAVASDREAAGAGEDGNHGEAVREVARDNHGQETAAEHQAGGAGDGAGGDGEGDGEHGPPSELPRSDSVPDQAGPRQ